MRRASSGWTSSNALAPSLKGYEILPSMTRPKTQVSVEQRNSFLLLRINYIFMLKYLLASKHRDFIKIVLAKPIDSNPLGLGQTPTHICSRIE